MRRSLAALFILTGVSALTGSAASVTFDYKGVTNQLQGDVSSGIFNVPQSGAPVSGGIGFDPSAFSPNPVAPSGQPYLVPFSGGAGSVWMNLSDAGGSATIFANSAYLLLCSLCTTPWSLLVNSGDVSFTVQMTSQSPLVLSPGTSLFGLPGQLDDGATLSVLLNDSNSALGFNMTDVVATPEPATAGLSLLALAIVALLWRRRVSNQAVSASSLTS